MPTMDMTVRGVMDGMSSVKDGSAQESKAPTLTEDRRAMVAGLGTSLAHIQERALPLVGFAGVYRRSELVALDVSDVAFTRTDMVITSRRSVTDQTGSVRPSASPTGRTPRCAPCVRY